MALRNTLRNITSITGIVGVESIDSVVEDVEVVDMILTESATERLRRQIIRLETFEPWWASVALRLRRVTTDRIPTMATDGTSLLYNPGFIEGCGDEELFAVLLHELAHVVLLHPYRRRGRDPLLWNLACDAVVNRILVDSEYHLPVGAIPAGPSCATAEELYETIPILEISMDVLDGSPADAQIGASMTEADWREVLAASPPGSVPAALRHSVAELTASVIDWQEVVARFVASHSAEWTRTWKAVNRRFPAFLPGRCQEEERTLAVCIDTSGSMTGTQLLAVAAEAKSLAELQNLSVWLITGDAVVMQRLAPGEPFPTEVGGGGGTDFRPLLQEAEALKVDGIVYLTDGAGMFPPSCTIPVLWVLTDKQVHPPFGEVLYLKKGGQL